MKYLASYNRLTRAEVGILTFVLLTAFRICLLPAVISEGAGESCVYVILAGMGVDLAVTFVALKVASMGGLANLHIPALAKRIVGGVLALFFFFKVVVHVYEAVNYCVGELFDQATPLLLAVVFVLTAAILASKGFAGVARTGIMFVPVIAFLAVLSVFFAEFGGYGYNLWVLLRPHDVGKGILYSMLWLGDGALFVFADTRAEGAPRKAYRWGLVAFAVALVTMLAFYLNFVYTYGSAGRYVQYAFVRMLTNGDPEELGAVDWPIMLIWLLSVPLYLASLFYAGTEGVRLVATTREHGGFWVHAVSALAVGLCYYFLFADKDGFVRLYQSKALSYALVGVLGVIVLAAFALAVRGRKEGAQ